MTMTLYNTLTREKEPLRPVTEGKIGIYVCGPTVYSEPHLGHARGPVVFDVLRRWLEYDGYEVRLVTNITDVGHLTDDADEGEDKLLKRAKLEQLEPMEIAEKYFWAYFDALHALNVRRPSIVPRATGHIIEQIEMTQDLLDRGLAYERNGSVYFDVSAWKPYGKLSGRDPEDLVEGTRVAVRSEKDDPRDFALWKRAEAGHIMRWPSPWSEGFPGWHIECSVMSTKYLGDAFDIHGGGLDLIFPHHECEIAQAEGAGKEFARVWMHWNMLTLEGEKMAKSKGHFVTLAELFDQFDPIVVRFHLLRAHYRSVSEFSEEALQSSAQGLKRLRDAYRRMRELGGEGSGDEDSGDHEVLGEHRAAFRAAMEDDLNTPQAIASLFDAVRDVHARGDDVEPAWARSAASFFETRLETVLGVPVASTGGERRSDLLSGVVEMLLEQRQQARVARDFATADAIRNRLADLGVEVEDSAEDSRWRLA